MYIPMFNLFKQKEQVNETLSTRITELTQEVIIIKQKLHSIELENDDLRNKVLRKIQKNREDTQDDIQRVLKAGQKVKG